MLLSAERRGELRVLGITTVAGNTSVKNATRNTRRLLATYGRLDVPVYAGAHCFLLSGTDDPPYQYHGENGLGNARFEEPLPAVKQRPEHAVTALSRLASEHKGELTVVALGPLTNIALAARMDQEFMTNINDIYLMGGNYTGLGNVKPSGEFNFVCDPEAANIVLASVRRPILIASWEVCLNHGLDMAWRKTVLGAVDSPAARFFGAAERAVLEDRTFGDWITCDQAAAAMLIRPEIVLKQSTHHATVELHGKLTRGLMVVDRRSWSEPTALGRNVTVIEALDLELYKKMLLDAFGHPGVVF
ncbi:uncharacterized protein C1683.06c-like [Pollicipes pollicipes]|uniref:uncharacterized protein C1683.06c-like n=1 Tax=Pollicipes pollicipes TaxID=41117 RepID=UPI0018855003|nr:uncharacterized protein C1683.06c-like [Pollicipes pollicipes]